MPRDQLVSFVTDVERLDEEELVERFRLPQVDAETLVPAMLVYRELLLSTSAAKVVVPDVSLRDGMLVDLAGAGQDQSHADFERQVLASAQTMGEKYRYDGEHAQTVRRLAGQIFDQLKTEHRSVRAIDCCSTSRPCCTTSGCSSACAAITNTASTFSRPPRSSACRATT